MSAQLNPLNPNERMINVPGRGPMTESDFRSAVQNGDIAAGPGGSAASAAIDSGNYSDPYANGQNGSQNTSHNTNGQSNNSNNGNSPGTNGNPAAVAANNMGAANKGTAFGSIMGNEAEPRTENVYALRNNDDPTSWARRVFAQGTADFNPNKSLNPYLSQNPNANSPFARWYQDRYGLSAPTNALVAAELGNQSPTSTYTQGQMQSMANNNQATGPGTMEGATSNLRGLQGMLQNSFQPNNGGLSPQQFLFSQQLNNDPQLASQIITGQLQGATGGWGMGYLSNALSNLATQYYNDPANQGPQAKGSFLGQAMKMMGMG